MNLLHDLLQALLIPLATWEMHVFGIEIALPVTPLLLVAAMLVADQAVRRLRRRARGPQVAVPTEG